MARLESGGGVKSGAGEEEGEKEEQASQDEGSKGGRSKDVGEMGERRRE